MSFGAYGFVGDSLGLLDKVKKGFSARIRVHLGMALAANMTSPLPGEGLIEYSADAFAIMGRVFCGRVRIVTAETLIQRTGRAKSIYLLIRLLSALAFLAAALCCGSVRTSQPRPYKHDIPV